MDSVGIPWNSDIPVGIRRIPPELMGESKDLMPVMIGGRLLRGCSYVSDLFERAFYFLSCWNGTKQERKKENVSEKL